MAQVTYFGTATLPLAKVFDPGARRTSFSAAEVVWTNPDGSRVVATGTGFAFDELGAILGGTLTRIDRFDAAGTGVLVRFDLSGPELWLFEAAWFAGGAPFNPLMFGDDNVTGGPADDEVSGFHGNNTIDGGPGIDLVNYAFAYVENGGVVVDLGAGTAQAGSGLDTLVSIEGVIGGDGADMLTAGSVALGPGLAYRLDGGNGDDVLTFPSAAAGLANPGIGYDIVSAPDAPTPGRGEATRQAGPLVGHGVEVSYADDGGAFAASFNYASAWIADPHGNFDTLEGGVVGARMTAGDDSFSGGQLGEYIAGLAGADNIGGGFAFDTVRHDLDAAYGGGAGVVVDLAAGLARDGFGDFDTLTGIEHAVGTNQAGAELPGGSDVLLGDGAFNMFAGLGGADYIDGRDGEDMADYSLDGLNGGGEVVYVNLAAGFGRDGFGGFDALVNVEHVRGSNGGSTWGEAPGDVLLGGDGPSMIQGLRGVDLIDGGAGGGDTVSYEADAAFDGAAGVIVDLAAGEAIDGFGDGDMLVGIENVIGTERDQAGMPGVGDILLGDGGANRLEGLGGNDRLDGRGGDDELASGAGSDVMTGGEGADVFHFDVALPGTDIITDFVAGVDRIAIALPWEFAGLGFEAVAGGVAVWRDGGATALVVMGAASAAEVQAAFIVVPPS